MIIQVSAKCSDCCFVVATDDSGNPFAEEQGYVPDGIGIGGGDYVEFSVDTTTGKIIGFPTDLTKEDIQKALR